MAKVKYKEYFDKMITENKELFEEFKALHAKYDLDEDKYQEEFNTKGKVIKDIVHDWENRLCSNTERGMYSSFSGGLSEKFYGEVRKAFPLFDHIGIISVKAPVFNLKKIKL